MVIRAPTTDPAIALAKANQIINQSLTREYLQHETAPLIQLGGK